MVVVEERRGNSKKVTKPHHVSYHVLSAYNPITITLLNWFYTSFPKTAPVPSIPAHFVLKRFQLFSSKLAKWNTYNTVEHDSNELTTWKLSGEPTSFWQVTRSCEKVLTFSRKRKRGEICFYAEKSLETFGNILPLITRRVFYVMVMLKSASLPQIISISQPTDKQFAIPLVFDHFFYFFRFIHLQLWLNQPVFVWKD